MRFGQLGHPGTEGNQHFFGTGQKEPFGQLSLQARHGINAKSDWKVGHAGEAIAKFAEAGKYDLLVMGSHGHGTLGNLVMGSVATQVLAHCKVPVLLVR